MPAARAAWMAPLAVGLITFGGLVLWGPTFGPPHKETSPVPALDATPESWLDFALAPGPGTPPGNYSLLRLNATHASGADAATTLHLPAIVAGAYADGTLRTVNATVTLRHAGGVGSNATAAPVARFGVGDRNVTRVTAYVFRLDGLLLATNDNDLRAARYPHSGDYRKLPEVDWYLGNAQAPNGTTAVPRLIKPVFDQLRPGLVGLPVGGVSTVRIDSGILADLYGSVYVTVRVESLAVGR